MPDDAGAVTETATVGMRNYLSTHHLYAARFAAENALPLEDGPVSMPNFIRHRGHVLTAAIESLAFLEAAINEIYQDCADGDQPYIEPLGETTIGKLAALWTATDGGKKINLVGKYSMALSLADKEPLDKGVPPAQEVELLRTLRNYLVHYTPETVSTGWSTTLGKRLADRGILGNPQFPGNPWFPDQALSASCARWCWRSARAFTDEFSTRIGLSLNYQLADFGDPLPD